MKVVLIQNVVFGGERKVAGEIVDLEDKVAKEFLKADLAAPYGEIENGEVVVDADPEILKEAEVGEEAAPEQAEESEAEAEAEEKAAEEAAPEQEEKQEAEPKQEAPKKTAKKTGGKAKK